MSTEAAPDIKTRIHSQLIHKQKNKKQQNRKQSGQPLMISATMLARQENITHGNKKVSKMGSPTAGDHSASYSNMDPYRVVKLSVFQSFRGIPGRARCVLTLKAPKKSASENVTCLCCLLHLLANFSNKLFAYTQTVDPDQTAPRGAV